MSQQIRRRRGTTAQHAAFTGAGAELTVDTDKNTVVVHDGVTVGGHPLAREAALATKADAAGTADALAARLVAANNLSDLTDPATARANIGAGILAGFRNRIINGDFIVNQRSGTRTPGVGVYGFDRWKGHANGLEQVIEALEAGSYTLTWTGGGTGTFGGVTAASPFVASTAGGNVSVVVPSDATRVSLVPGDATAEADPFSPRHIQQELALCQRYYETFSDRTFFRAGTSAGQIGTEFTYVVPKRNIPTVAILNTVYNINCSDLSASAGTVSAFSVGWISGDASIHSGVSFGWFADAEL